MYMYIEKKSHFNSFVFFLNFYFFKKWIDKATMSNWHLTFFPTLNDYRSGWNIWRNYYQEIVL